MIRNSFLGVCILTLAYSIAIAKDIQHQSPYAGQQSRPIKSLSDDDIADLEAGAGWGLAKAAELNGVPGPMHLLEMKDEIDLSDTQIERIVQVFNDMRAAAKTLGEKLIHQETVLDEKFRNNIPTTEELQTLLEEIGGTRTSLRYVHLSAHLKMPDILSVEQIENYNRLRGYTDADPCTNIPIGHNETMWKKHNNCG